MSFNSSFSLKKLSPCYSGGREQMLGGIQSDYFFGKKSEFKGKWTWQGLRITQSNRNIVFLNDKWLQNLMLWARQTKFLSPLSVWCGGWEGADVGECVQMKSKLSAGMERGWTEISERRWSLHSHTNTSDKVNVTYDAFWLIRVSHGRRWKAGRHWPLHTHTHNTHINSEGSREVRRIMREKDEEEISLRLLAHPEPNLGQFSPPQHTRSFRNTVTFANHNNVRIQRVYKCIFLCMFHCV